MEHIVNIAHKESAMTVFAVTTAVSMVGLSGVITLLVVLVGGARGRVVAALRGDMASARAAPRLVLA